MCQNRRTQYVINTETVTKKEAVFQEFGLLSAQFVDKGEGRAEIK